MELRHLRYFVATGEDQHYGRAARRLSVAQPALSRQIQDLEKELGFELFERLPRGVKLSTAGALFLEDARRILQEVKEAVARAAQVARGRSGTLRIGFPEDTLWLSVVPKSFRRFRESQPNADDFAGARYEIALAARSSLEKGQQVPAARRFPKYPTGLP
jgi:DNA-binding transcriptional LysR family regulator